MLAQRRRGAQMPMPLPPPSSGGERLARVCGHAPTQLSCPPSPLRLRPPCRRARQAPESGLETKSLAEVGRAGVCRRDPPASVRRRGPLATRRTPRRARVPVTSITPKPFAFAKVDAT